MELNINMVMYLIIILLVLVILLTEQADWKCSNTRITSLINGCGENGMPYRGSKPEKTDDCKILLDKINLASSSTSKSIKWRRSFIFAFLISFVIYILVITPGKLPNWTQFYVIVIIITSVLYFNLNYYDYHKYSIPREYIEESTNLIEEKIRKNSC